jgi:hypothetical protein
VGNYFWAMTDKEFDKDLRDYISDLSIADKPILTTEFYINIQPSMVSFGGHFVFTDNESIPLDIRRKTRLSNKELTNKIKSFHTRSINGGLNKWNRATFNLDSTGQIKSEFIWDKIWEQEEISADNAQAESTRQKWYWE